MKKERGRLVSFQEGVHTKIGRFQRGEEQISPVPCRSLGLAFLFPPESISAAISAGRRLMPVPNAPSELLGVCAVGGSAVPIYDFARVCGLGSTTTTGHRLILVLRSGFGLFVESVLTPIESLVPAQPAPGVRDLPFITGAEASGDLLWHRVNADLLSAHIAQLGVRRAA